eukprot:3496437-Karenia_brevis.AAC.1
MFDDDGGGSSVGTVKDFNSQELQDNASELFDAIAEQPTGHFSKCGHSSPAGAKAGGRHCITSTQ